MLIRHCKFLIVTLLAFATLQQTTLAAAPMPVEQVPDPLQPWVNWVLHDDTERGCPYRYNRRERACRWPSQLALQLNEQGGTFTQRWQVFSNTAVRLPGDQNNWPQQVTRRQAGHPSPDNGQPPGKALLIEEKNGLPYARLSAGTHIIQGRFLWKKLPKALRVTPESGLITLSVNGETIAHPRFNQQGQLWLTQGNTEAASEDNLDIQVFRKISDSHPIQVTTSIKLRVSGKQRNVTLSPVLLEGFIPLQLDSALPARMEGARQLQVQLRPGEWTLQVTGRAGNDQTAFTLPESKEPWPQQEVWVFAADSAMRQVEVSGVNSIDPNQTRLPDNWKTLPAYLMAPQQTLELNVIQRGAAQTGKHQLNLQREMWLDYDGNGYTLKDEIKGNIRQQSRLNVRPELALGRVSIDGQPQFITRQQTDSAAGVEIRSENIRLQAESRYQGKITTPPVNGWEHDLQRVNTTLHLPPGWFLFSASDTDNQPNSWLQNWSLLDLFLVLVIALATGYLFGGLWGGFALLTLVFIWHEHNAPQFIWLNLLAVIALLRVLPDGWLKQWLGYYRWLSLLVLAFIALPYMIDTLRIGLYPQLAHQHAIERQYNTVSTFSTANESSETEAVMAEPQLETDAEMDMMQDYMPQQAPMVKQSREAYTNSIAAGKAMLKPAPRRTAPPARKRYDMKAIDPNSMIQTGPGLPDWRSYRPIRLNWTGPVKAGETSRLLLVGPKMNLLIKLLGILLLLGLAWRMSSLSNTFSWPPRQWFQSGRAKNGGNKSGGNKNEPDKNKSGRNNRNKLSKKTLKLLPLLLLPALLLSQPPVRAETIPDQQLLQTLRERLNAPPDCLPQCAQIEQMQVLISANTLRARLLVHAAIDTAIPLPGSQDTWLADKVLLNRRIATGISRDANQQLWLSVPAGQHEIGLVGVLPARNSIPLPLPLKPHYVSWQIKDQGWTLEGVRDNGTPESQLQLNRVLNASEKAQLEQEQNILPTFVKIERQLHLGLDWHVDTIVRRLAPLDTPLSLSIPLLPNEQPMSEQLSVKNQRIKINLGAGQMETRWSSRLNPGGQLVLKAAETADYLESWHIAASPVWHVQAAGLPVNQYRQEEGQRVPVWQPWPGETLTLNISRPQGIPGQTITILSSHLNVNTGKRANDATLHLNIRSSRGVQHALQIPDTAEVQELKVDGVAQRIQSTDNKLNITLKPGQQQVSVQWREAEPLSLAYRFPAVNLGLPSVNSKLSISPPNDRWILWVNGPTPGPAVLFWGVLLALLLVSLALGYSRLTPLKSWQWFLLGIGLSQTEPVLMILVAGWLIAIALREKLTIKLKYWQFDLMQLALAGLTVIALLVLVVALSHGLLGQPEMQIAGNGSSASYLSWYQDRSGEVLPQPSVFSVPLWLYRVLMLAWALWLAVAVLGWLRWGWQAMNVGGLWQRKPPKPASRVADSE